MNRQAIAFISLFSLILMLSVYYISMDDDSIEVMEQPQEVVIDESIVMKEELEGNQESDRQEQKEIIGGESSMEEKEEALNKIEQLDQLGQLSQEMMDLLKENGIVGVVEIDEHVVRVCVFEQQESSELANEIMSLLYELVPMDKTIELTFS